VYRLSSGSTTAGRVSALIVFLLAGGLSVGGCKSAPPAEPAVPVAGKSDGELLYEATVESFRERSIEIGHASGEHRVVTSEFDRVSDRLRRRFTARIIGLPGGANGLRVKIDYERRFGEGEGANWKSVESAQLRKRAQEAELELARAIEKRYRRWREYRDRQGGVDSPDAGSGGREKKPDRPPGPEGPSESGPEEAPTKPSFGPGR